MAGRSPPAKGVELSLLVSLKAALCQENLDVKNSCLFVNGLILIFGVVFLSEVKIHQRE